MIIIISKKICTDHKLPTAQDPMDQVLMEQDHTHPEDQASIPTVPYSRKLLMSEELEQEWLLE